MIWVSAAATVVNHYGNNKQQWPGILPGLILLKNS
jgi:hypothetical protein